MCGGEWRTPILRVLLRVLLLLWDHEAVVASPAPHLVHLLVDDLGWSDVACWEDHHCKKQTFTPHIDELARKRGRILSRFYTFPCCSPSRAALFTGRYSHRVTENNAGYVHEGFRLLPEVLREHGGYKTHLVGKWHLGGDQDHYWHLTPVARGFETFYGMLGGAGDHYLHHNMKSKVDRAHLKAQLPLQNHTPHRRKTQETR